MRNPINQKTAASVETPLPFEGLGLAMDGIREAALGMAPVRHRHPGELGIPMPIPAPVVQPSGYSLLVALCREIRGR
jgi:hypothetical protein